MASLHEAESIFHDFFVFIPFFYFLFLLLIYFINRSQKMLSMRINEKHETITSDINKNYNTNSI